MIHNSFNITYNRNIYFSDSQSYLIINIIDCKIKLSLIQYTILDSISKNNYTNSSNIVKEPKINIKRIVNEFNFKPRNNLIDLLNHLIINYKNNLLK